jgi:hypothetical protein
MSFALYPSKGELHIRAITPSWLQTALAAKKNRVATGSSVLGRV